MTLQAGWALDWGLALATLYTLGWIPLFVIRPESMSDSLPQYSPAERVAVVAATLIVSLHVTLTCLTAAFGFPSAQPIETLPAVLSAFAFAGAIAFWIWARRYIGPLFVQRKPEERPQELQSTGPFGIVRNPLYLGALAAAGAPLIALPRPYLFVTFALCGVALGTRAFQDEQRMLAQLGEPYAEYCRKVKRRLLPFVW